MRYIIGVLITIGLIVVALILILRSGGSTPTPSTPNLAKYANTSTVVQWTQDGPINADQDHRQVRVTVGQDQITADVLQGYQGQVLRSKTYENNSTAYASFLHALQQAGYSNGSKSASLRDERGHCPNGERYIYEVKDGNNTIQRYWSTSCGGGSYKGGSNLTNGLFMNQVPDYDALTGDLLL